MKGSVKTGISFGLTSAVITTLGMIVGLNSGTKSIIAIISGVLTIAVADSLSEALGIHISEESKGDKKPKEIWAATISTFISKFLFAISFIIPILLFNLSTAIIISLIWGFLLLVLISYWVAKENNTDPKRVISEHVSIAAVVVIATHYLGVLINSI